MSCGTNPDQTPTNSLLGDMAKQSLNAFVLRPTQTATPQEIGDMVFQRNSDTEILIKLRGADGVVRQTVIGGKESFETVAQNLDAADSVPTYTDGNLTKVVYSNGITKTMAYVNDEVVTITLSGATPSGIDLVKTISYVDGEWAGSTYS